MPQYEKLSDDDFAREFFRQLVRRFDREATTDPTLKIKGPVTGQVPGLAVSRNGGELEVYLGPGAVVLTGEFRTPRRAVDKDQPINLRLERDADHRDRVTFSKWTQEQLSLSDAIENIVTTFVSQTNAD